MSRPQTSKLASQCAERNAAHNISGALLFAGEHFLQLLEGELADVMSLYEKVRLDARYTDVRCLPCKNVAKRLFPE